MPLRGDATTGEHETEAGPVRCHPDVGGQQQRDPHAHRRPVHRGDHRLQAVEQPQRDPPAPVPRRCRPGHPFGPDGPTAPSVVVVEGLGPRRHVRSGAEGPPISGQDDHPHAVVTVQARSMASSSSFTIRAVKAFSWSAVG